MISGELFKASNVVFCDPQQGSHLNLGTTGLHNRINYGEKIPLSTAGMAQEAVEKDMHFHTVNLSIQLFARVRTAQFFLKLIKKILVPFVGTSITIRPSNPTDF